MTPSKSPFGSTRRRRTHRAGIALAMASLVLAVSRPGLAQSEATAEAEPDSVRQEDGFVSLQWWHPLVAGAAVGAVMLVDEPVQEFVQDHRSEFKDDLADIFEEFHQPEVVGVASIGAMSLGLVLRDAKLAETGVQILTAYGLASGMMIATKWAFGRDRPNVTPDDAFSFNWFEGGSDSSFPSGAAAVSFSLATTVADAVDKPVVTVLLYTGATLNAWSRVYSNKHWLSDVALGAIYGITAAKIVNGHWRLWGWKPPTVGIAGDGGIVLGYNIRH